MDVFTAKKRSEVMSRIRSTGNKGTEVALIGVFRDVGLIGWRRKQTIVLSTRSRTAPRRKVSVRPDFVFPSRRIAIFVDGEFWHGHPTRGRMPASNQEYWLRKISGNIRRDRRQTAALRASGWTVVRIWQYQLSLRHRHWALRKLRKAGLIP